MSNQNNLLVELFVEELPPKSLKKLGESFAETLSASLKAQGLAAADAAVTSFASPRRLAVHISNVLAQAPEKKIATKLMPRSVAFDMSDMPSPALIRRMQQFGIQPTALEKMVLAMDTEYDIQQFINTVNELHEPVLRIQKAVGKVPETLFHIALEKGESIKDGLQKALEDALAKLPIAKVMSYQLADGWSSVNFVRPAHGLVALHGADVVPVSTLGLNAGRDTHGHRFEAKNATVTLKDADSYAQQLENEGAVIASFAARRAEIVRQLTAAAAKEGLKPIDDDALLDEVTALVERPNVLVGQFETEFLAVPQECLILTMKANQKYFPLLDANGKLTNKFLIVSNISPKDASLVVGGNERVVRPRLADAKFFFDQDRKKPLDARVLGLSKVVYHNKLGTQGERVQRVQAIARAIGQQLGGDALAAQADQAALLAKADLLTDMVGEFPELQGIMGRYYAQHDGLGDDIAFAIEDHYKPRFAGDELPRSMVGVCVALADKLETLVGMFGIGQIPTGDKDPFALRRHALGVIRMLVERDLPLNVESLLRECCTIMDQMLEGQIGTSTRGTDKADFASNLDPASSPVLENILGFIYERLAGNLRDQSYSTLEVEAVLALRPQRLSDISKRLAAVRIFAALPESPSLAAANKRVGNILKKSEDAVGDKADAALFQEDAERALHQALNEIVPRADAAFDAGDYTASLQALAALRAPVDAFFDNVMVNAEDAKLRANRLALLAQLHRAMNRVADISKLAS